MFSRRQASDRGEGTDMNSVVMPSNGICLDIGTPPANGVPLKECYTSEDEHAPKVRKPYTITKQRERWTEEEHQKFLEALKLYGRAWRRIEEHIGSKTAVQIRSHAQKFFSKVVRESVGSRGGSIEIPPPRPKRKPMHPYPRKFVNSSKKGISVSEQVDRRSPSPISSVSEQENRSPSSVLCTVVSDTMGSSVSNPPNTCSSPVSSADDNRFPSSTLSAEEENGSPSPIPVNAVSSPNDKSSMKSDLGSKDDASTKESSSVEMPTITLKLFGRTVLVTDAHRPSSCSTVGNIQQTHRPSPIVDIIAHQKNPDLNAQNPVQTFPGHDTTINNFSAGQLKGTQKPAWPCGVLPALFNCSQFQQENSTSAEATTSLPWWAFYGNVPFLFIHPHGLNSTEIHSDCNNTEALSDKEMQREGSWTGSNTASVSEVGKGDKNSDVESISREPSDKEMDYVPAFHLRVSENSAFSSPPSRSTNCSKGFVPYKRCLAERDVRQPQIGGDVIEGQRIKLSL